MSHSQPDQTLRTNDTRMLEFVGMEDWKRLTIQRRLIAFRMKNGMPDNLLDVLHGNLVFLAKINASLAGLIVWVLFLECRQMSRTARIKRNVVLLICNGDPSVSLAIGRHLVTHIYRRVREAFDDRGMKRVYMLFPRIRH